MNKEIIDLSEQLQTQANNHVIELMKKCSDKTNYQDAINVWLFLKLAELEIELLNLKNSYGITRNTEVKR
jgi:hypothetical protein